MGKALSAAGGSVSLAVTIGLLVTGLTATSAATPTQVRVTEMTKVTGPVVAGEYVVTTRPGAATAERTGVDPKHEYREGFAATLTVEQLRAVQRDRDVLAIEPNQVVRPTATQRPAPWPLDRIDQPYPPLDGGYTYTATGRGVTAYIVDSGITPYHPQFAGRAAIAYDATGGNGQDCSGHGTYLAGLVGSVQFGVAKEVALRGVRALGCGVPGTVADVIEALDWVQFNSPGPAVALLAIGGAYSSALNAKVNELSLSGVFVAVAAGNSAMDACATSPASAVEAFAAAATDAGDRYASFSNYGRCVDICAPGVNVTSTWLNNGYLTASGTSGAAAHVAGVAALYKHAFGDAPSATVAAWLRSVASPVARCSVLHTNGI